MIRGVSGAVRQWSRSAENRARAMPCRWQAFSTKRRHRWLRRVRVMIPISVPCRKAPHDCIDPLRCCAASVSGAAKRKNAPMPSGLYSGASNSAKTRPARADAAGSSVSCRGRMAVSVGFSKFMRIKGRKSLRPPLCMVSARFRTAGRPLLPGKRQRRALRPQGACRASGRRIRLAWVGCAMRGCRCTSGRCIRATRC